MQMTSQLSFDPLSGPDPLAAFTQARQPSDSWMSFEDDGATSAGPFHQSSMASNVDAKSADAASGQVTHPAAEMSYALQVTWDRPSHITRLKYCMQTQEG